MTIYGVAAVPWLTGLSFGVIPTTVEEGLGYAFSLTRTHAPMDQIAVEFRYEGPSTLGWQASYLNMFRNGTGRDVHHHPRHLAWNIVQLREFIGQPMSDSCALVCEPPFNGAHKGSHQAIAAVTLSESVHEPLCHFEEAVPRA